MAYIDTMDSFYHDLPPIERFQDVFQADAFASVPDDWWIVVLDVRDSTEWIRQGRYRDVNFIGASSIAALRNAATDRDLPYVFGGDGATLLIPEGERKRVGQALLGVALAAESSFGMPLHTGMINVGTLRRAGHDTLIARYQASGLYHQAILQGTGASEAERRVKLPGDPDVYRMGDISAVEPDFTGVECRWRPIKSAHGEVVSLLVEARDADEYRRLLAELDTRYGPDHVRHPALPSALRPSFNPAELGARESRVRRRRGRRLLYTMRIWIQQFLLLLFIRLDLNVGDIAWRRYLPTLSETSDVRKFDGMLRMVLSGTAEQRRGLEAYLTERYAAGALNWGTHVSDSAIMTCLVYERLGDQVHFIDGASGGYAMAAAALKARRGQKDSG